MSSRHGEIDITVTVEKAELLARLKANREKHSKEYDGAIRAWQEALKVAIADVDVSTCFSAPEALETLLEECPESHIQEYEQAIDMFTMCTTSEIKLDSESFNTFCRDDWGWKEYASTNRFYTRARLRS